MREVPTRRFCPTRPFQTIVQRALLSHDPENFSILFSLDSPSVIYIVKADLCAQPLVQHIVGREQSVFRNLIQCNDA